MFKRLHKFFLRILFLGKNSDKLFLNSLHFLVVVDIAITISEFNIFTRNQRKIIFLNLCKFSAIAKFWNIFVSLFKSFSLPIVVGRNYLFNVGIRELNILLLVFFTLSSQIHK